MPTPTIPRPALGWPVLVDVGIVVIVGVLVIGVDVAVVVNVAVIVGMGVAVVGVEVAVIVNVAVVVGVILDVDVLVGRMTVSYSSALAIGVKLLS